MNRTASALIIIFISILMFGCGDDQEDLPAEVKFVEVLPNLTFNLATDLQSTLSLPDQLFVGEQVGIIQRVIGLDGGDKAIFLDISGKTLFNDRFGLMGFTFHPDFATNGHFYVHYTRNNPDRSVISRFTADPASNDPASVGTEMILLEVNQPHKFHNGGQLVFGPDGYLYIAFGDGGPHNGTPDPDGNGQDRGTFLGSVLRIDVDNPAPGFNYGIPPDNPFAGNTEGYLEEIFAYGFRNPWRLSFDAGTGQIWSGENGEDNWEEINLIEKGKNYGWKVMEGNACFRGGCDPSAFETPLFVYGGNTDRRSVIGGYVYRGSQIPEMIGKYIYADFLTGFIWSLSGEINPVNEVVQENFGGVTSFGTDASGELYLTRFEGAGSKIYKMVLE